MSRDKCKLRKMLAMAQYLPTLWPVSPSLSWYSADLEGAAQLVPSLDYLVLADLIE